MDTNNKKSDVKKGAFISILTIFGKILGFVKQSIIAWAFGSSGSTDAYFAADGYTSMFGQIMNQSISPSVLTNHIALNEKGKKEEAINLVRSAFVFFPIVALIICLLSIIFSKYISSLVGLSYELNQRKILQIYLIALCPVIVLSSITGVSQGFLESKHIFVPGKLFSLFFSVCIIVFVIVFNKSIGVDALLWGFLTGYTLHCGFMLFFVNRHFRFRFVNPFSNKDFLRLLKKFLPLLIGVSIVDLGHLADRIIASSMEEGSVSALYYGQVISNDIVNAAIIGIIGTILLPAMTKEVVKDSSNDRVVGIIRKVLAYTFLGMLLIISLYIIVGYDLVTVFFERGSFTADDTKRVYSVAIGYASGFVFLSFNEILTRVHYAYSDTLFPMIGSICGVCVNIGLNLLLGHYFGVGGIAIATSITLFIIMLFSIITLRRFLPCKLFNARFLISLIKALLSAAISCSLVLVTQHFLPIGIPILSLFLFGSLFVVLYLLLLICFKHQEIIDVVKKIRSFLLRKKENNNFEE